MNPYAASDNIALAIAMFTFLVLLWPHLAEHDRNMSLAEPSGELDPNAW